MSKPIAAMAGRRLAAVAKVPDRAGVGGTSGWAGSAGVPGVAGVAALAGTPGDPGIAGFAGVGGVAGRPGTAGRPERASTAPSDRGNISYQALNSARSRSTQIVPGSHSETRSRTG